jgi:hypothetical protein
VDEVIGDQVSGDPQWPDEWANVLGLVHHLAGACGLLAMAEEGATPRVLADLAGPLARSGDVAAVQRRIAGSRHALPPGPGEASMSTVRNSIQT